MSGFPVAAGEEEAAGGFLSAAARPGDAGKEMCHHPEGADPAGAASGGDQVGGEEKRIEKNKGVSANIFNVIS